MQIIIYCDFLAMSSLSLLVCSFFVYDKPFLCYIDYISHVMFNCQGFDFLRFYLPCSCVSTCLLLIPVKLFSVLFCVWNMMFHGLIHFFYTVFSDNIECCIQLLNKASVYPPVKYILSFHCFYSCSNVDNINELD